MLRQPMLGGVCGEMEVLAVVEGGLILPPPPLLWFGGVCGEKSVLGTGVGVVVAVVEEIVNGGVLV